MPICLRLLTQWILRAACLAWLSAGNKREAEMAMTAIITRISTKVNPLTAPPRRDELRFNDGYALELKQDSGQVHRKPINTKETKALRRSSKSARIRPTVVGIDNRLAVARVQMNIRTGAASPVQKVFANHGFSLNVAIMTASLTGMPTPIAVKIEIRFANGRTRT